MSSNSLRHRDVFGLAGWLFADLLLALAVLFLISSPPGVATVAATPSPSPTATPRTSLTPTLPPLPTASPTPEPTRCTNTVVLRKNVVDVPAQRSGIRASDATVKAAFAIFKDARIGLLLTFVHGATPGAGVTAAGRVNQLVSAAFPSAVTKLTIKENYFNSTGAVGSIQFVAYLIADTCK